MAYEFLFANNATTTLAQAISATATVITVASGDGALFPNPQSGQAFAVTLVDAETGLTNEICYCTSRSGDELTVIRGQEGKNALAWSAGDTCANYITADVIESWVQESDLAGYMLLSTTAQQTVTGPVTFSGTTLVPTITNMSSRQAVGAADLGSYALLSTVEASQSWTPVTASQYLTAPSWAKYLEVIQIGGGGGGAGCQGSSDSSSVSGSGGGGGGVLHSRHSLSGVTSIAQYIGAAGTAGSGANSGGDGGDTWLVLDSVTVATAGGGVGGQIYAVGGSYGGSGGINTLSSGVEVGNYTGSSGFDGQLNTNHFNGNGAPGYLGCGAGRGGSEGGENATSVGAGGGGAYDSAFSGNSYLGGTGGAGKCLYRWIP